MPFSRFTLGPQVNQQIISITGGATPAIYFRDQKVTLEQLGPLLDTAKKEGRSIIIKADRSTPYEMVIAVTNAALEHGITSVALATSSATMNAATATESLAFRLGPPRTRKLAIAGFLPLPLLLHAFCFYLFQIVYPPAVALLPPPARVSLIADDSEEGAHLLALDRGGGSGARLDHAASAGRKRVPLPKLAHVPSYLDDAAGAKDVAAPKPLTRTSSAQPPAPVPIARVHKSPVRSLPTADHDHFLRRDVDS